MKLIKRAVEDRQLDAEAMANYIDALPELIEERKKLGHSNAVANYADFVRLVREDDRPSSLLTDRARRNIDTLFGNDAAAVCTENQIRQWASSDRLDAYR